MKLATKSIEEIPTEYYNFTDDLCMEDFVTEPCTSSDQQTLQLVEEEVELPERGCFEEGLVGTFSSYSLGRFVSSVCK